VLPGITRRLVLDLCSAHGIPARETPVFAHQLARAEELFLAGTTTEVLSIVQLDGRAVSQGRPGPLANRIRELFCTLASRLSE
jgi:D-alanine transaminase